MSAKVHCGPVFTSIFKIGMGVEKFCEVGNSR